MINWLKLYDYKKTDVYFLTFEFYLRVDNAECHFGASCLIGATPTTPFPLIYPGPATPTMFLPTPTGPAAVTQQLQFQTAAAAAAAAINNVAAAQSQVWCF